MTQFFRPTRRRFLQAATACIGAARGLPGMSPEHDPVGSGLKRLDERYWCEPAGIWLDREGDQLRAHWEGRVNAPWWSAANLVELLVDRMNQRKVNDDDARLETLHDLHRDPVKRWPRVAESLKAKGDWNDADQATLERRMARPSKHTEFRNEYLDDSAWWGIAWLKMHERTGETKYLDTARAIQAHMKHNWRPDLQGGVIWCEEAGKQKPNSITNSLYLILSARLAVVVSDGGYREAAEQAGAWLKEKRVFDGRGVVDAPGHQGDWWSYNQGAYMGGWVALAALTGDKKALDHAAEVAEVVLNQAGFADETGVVLEKLGTSGWDGCLFKGIFVRYLAQTRTALSADGRHAGVVDRLDRVLSPTRGALLQPDLLRNGFYPADWGPQGKNRETNFNTQLSGLIALQAGALQMR
ncbi:glycoside hydrolase family 76 protein [Verrucomicrobium sp. BvORR106]|uniref:glycoside hydrolase family 76 protein n=1 Tax=Verrucomicrobium sp. BvORR106 TaxID=1403819 RepID=UPI00056FE4E2|nr:glycoside hydrolase family 76 protein [Verrucomicrobium sp. BvORR106]